MADTQARLATLAEIRQNILPNYLTPVPSMETIRDWFNQAKIPRFKSNPAAKRGGGQCYYSLSAVEKLLRSRTLAK